MTRNFICQDTKSDKFWTIEVNGKSLTTTYGKNGKYNKSQTATKELATDETCLKEAEKQINKKLKEQYEEVNLHIPNIPVYALKQVQDAKEGKINNLKIDAIGSLDLLHEIFSISNLEELELSDITESDTKKELPAELGNLSNLKKLEIKYSQITKLPAEIGRLKKLAELEFYECKSLKELPSAIGDLINLKKLELTFSSFESLPEEIGNLENLEALHVFSNNVNTLPSALIKLKKLKKLRLAEDWKKLPSVVYKLENLEELNIESCYYLEELSPEICQLKKLKELYVSDEGNIKNVPEEILEDGLESILEHFRNRNNFQMVKKQKTVED